MLENFGCINNTIRLRSGRWFDFANPDPATIVIEDIAGALAKECRFGNQCDPFYSVCEHLIHCAMQAIHDGLSPECCFAVLMHDAAEAYTGDFCRPLKIMLPEFKAIEKRVEAAVGLAFGIDFEKHHDAIKKIDNEMVIAEKKRLFIPDGVEWTGENEVREILPSFRLYPCGAAEGLFLCMFEDLKSQAMRSPHGH